MSNRKDLKHSINIICQGLLAECIAASLYSGSFDKDNSDALLSSILKMQQQFVSRIAHPEPGMPQRKFYENLKNDFKEQANEIIDQINNLC